MYRCLGLVNTPIVVVVTGLFSYHKTLIVRGRGGCHRKTIRGVQGCQCGQHCVSAVHYYWPKIRFHRVDVRTHILWRYIVWRVLDISAAQPPRLLSNTRRSTSTEVRMERAN